MEKEEEEERRPGQRWREAEEGEGLQNRDSRKEERGEIRTSTLAKGVLGNKFYLTKRYSGI